MTLPEEKTDTPDELARLEKMHQRMKDEQEAWRKLLESLQNMKKKPIDPTATEQTST